MNPKKHILLIAAALFLATLTATAQKVGGDNARNKFYPGKLWFDTAGDIINAHGGGVIYHNGRYYWYGEHKGEHSNEGLVGVTCYSSTDLYNWRNEGVALEVSDNPDSPITRGCILERPKVIHNKKTDKFVMYFHLELKGKGYAAAQVGTAISDTPTGPFRFIRAGRVNPGKWPLGMDKKQQDAIASPDDYKEWWTPEWRAEIAKGMFVKRDLKGGQMSRDMTLYVDDDNKAYHIYSSEDNLTIHVAELTDDYLTHSGRYTRIDPAGHNEAPAIFKKDGRYYMITSGCTGWNPNAARLLTADNIMGPWTRHGNPCLGKGADLTFQSQSTYILPVQGKPGAFIFLADRWRPDNPIDGRYVWLPIEFEDGLPVLRWRNAWSLDVFK